MHLEVKLRDNVTTAELENAWSYANTAAMGGEVNLLIQFYQVVY